MSTFLTIAWRNLWRNKKRSLLTLAAIVFAVFLGLLMRSMQIGSYGAMIKGSVAYTGYIQVHGNEYWKHKSINHSFAYGKRLHAIIDSIDNISAGVPRLESFALASYGEQTRGALITGTDPEIENQFTSLADRIVNGTYIGKDDDGLLIAEKLAEYLNISVNDTLVILGQGYHGMTAAGTFPVRGILRFTLEALNNNVIYMPLGSAQYLFATPPVQLTSLSLMLHDPSKMLHTHQALKQAAGEKYEIMNWEEISVDMVQEIQSDNAGGIFMLIILYLIVGFGLLGSILMSTMERQKEFGIMNAVGMQKRHLSAVLLIETVLLSILGVICGIVISLPFLIYFHFNPIPVSGSVAHLFQEFNIPPYLPFSLEPGIFFFSSGDRIIDHLCGIFVSIIVYPSHENYQSNYGAIMIREISRLKDWRNRLRSSVIIMAIAVGLLGGIFSYAFMIGLSNQGVTSAIKTQLSNIQLHHPDYVSDSDIWFTIDNAADISQQISQQSHVLAVGTRIKTTAMASTATSSAGITISGVDPENEKTVSDLHTKLIEGNYLAKGDKIPMIISRKLADRLNAKLRAKVVVSIVNMEKTITYGAFRIVGIFQTTDSVFDEQHVFVNESDLRKLVEMPPGKTSEINVLLEKRSVTGNVASELKSQFPALSVRPWNELAPSLEALAQVSSQFAYFFLVIILLALTFGIINTMLMVVMERTREIGMLMSVGMAKRKIFRMIVYETTFLSLSGGLLGVIVSFLVILFFGARGIDLGFLAEGINALGYDAMIYPELEYSFYIVITVMVIITAVLAAIYPAVRALRLKPAEATRAET